MWQIFVVIGLGVTAALVSNERSKSKAAPKLGADGKPAPESKPKTPDELKAEGRAEVLAEIKSRRAKERELEKVVARAMRNSPRARVVADADDDDAKGVG